MHLYIIIPAVAVVLCVCIPVAIHHIKKKPQHGSGSRPEARPMMDTPKIDFGHRGEDITYKLGGRSVYLEFTHCNGPRIYPELIKSWSWNGAKEPISTEEKRKVLTDVVGFVEKEYGEQPVVVINPDDPDKEFWEEICRVKNESIKGFEYWSDKNQTAFEREMYLKILRAGKGLNLYGTDIKDEKHLDEFLRSQSSWK
jgi:hypothetical protein